MKKISIIAVCIGALAMTACSDIKRKPGRAYMPDMADSRAVETYTDPRTLQDKNINYTGNPVAGTVSRGEEVIYKMLKDTTGSYGPAASMKNPLPRLDTVALVEAERLYLINCGICHGGKLDGNGPLYKDGTGPYPAAPKNFMSDDMKKMTDGTYFHSVTYGKGMMGSYAAQLSPKQRWMVIHYIRSKQGVGAGEAPAAADSTATAAK
ncbi:c-type cytochrome [Flavihumibacter solisilvae]|uniref:c-type cytochrome n=1 Tax=Flavihumibacter solisilvae TaxID=1349421 RepID=UPI00068F2A7E|nr:cytochrome c [Flavihumibacter solisilvae]